MGGSIHSKGNSSKSAEFNFHYDPEAAHIVLDAAKKLNSCSKFEPLVKIVPWETTLNHAFTWSFMEELMPKSPTLLADFVHGYLKVAKEFAVSHLNEIESETEFKEYTKLLSLLLLPDFFCAACVEDDKLITAFEDLSCHVELNGLHSRGGMFFSWSGHSRESEPVNIRVILKLDSKSLETQLKLAFS